MNAKQRVRTAIRGGIPDRVPVFPVITDMHTTFLYDMPLWVTTAFPRLKTDLLEAAVRFYGFDGFEMSVGTPFSQRADLCVRCEGNKRFLYVNGIKEYELHDDNYPTPVIPPKKPAIATIDEAKKRIYLSAREYRDKGLLSEVERMKSRFGDEAYISSHAAGFTMNGLIDLRGTDNAFIDLYDEPELVHEIIGNLTLEAIETGKAIVSAGLDCIYIGDAFASCSVISPTVFEEFCLPYYKQFTQAMKPYDIDIYLHICGNSSPLFEMVAETGVNALEPLDPLGGVSVADAKCRVGGKIALKGGVNTLTLLNASVDETVAETRKCLEEGMAGGAFILGSGDDIPRCAKPENIIAMVETVRKYGKY